MDNASICDPTFDIGHQALVILQILNGTCPKEVGVDEAHLSDFEFCTRPLYNGRERGVCLCVRPTFNTPREAVRGNLVIVFGESRGSDDIFVTTFMTEKLAMFGAPPLTADDIPDHAYSSRKYFRCEDYNGASKHIRRSISSFVKDRYGCQRAGSRSKKSKS